LECTLPLLAEDKPWHLLGFGKIDEIFEVLNRGIDLLASRATLVKYASLSFGPGETKQKTWFHWIKISRGKPR